MLIDIFARRYQATKFRDSFSEVDRRLMVQATRILTEDVCPYPSSTKSTDTAHRFWETLHSRLSRELGLTELAPQWRFYTTKWNGNDVSQSYKYNPLQRCEKWMLEQPTGSADQHIKDRLSLVELAFRQRDEAIAAARARPIAMADQPPILVGRELSSLPRPKSFGEQISQAMEAAERSFRESVEELNTRFRQAGYSLHYHNGFIQAATDALVQETVETPFWRLVAEPRWQNVDIDMKQALDLRDSNGRDPAWYGARALESAIKIISDLKGWTTGTEKGAHNYIDNLAAKSNKFIDRWEASSLKEFFTHVRNPLGHGPGNAEMPKLTSQQSEWSIEFCMSWIKALILRL